jgi:hypothetical protein
MMDTAAAHVTAHCCLIPAGNRSLNCEAAGMIPYVPVMRTVTNQGNGKLFGREDFRYEPDSDTYVCPGNKRLLRKSTNHKGRYTM